MVGACLVRPDGQEIYGINHVDSEGMRIHAERAALNANDVHQEGSMMITTLSPCNRPMDDRSGTSCKDMLDYYGFGIEDIYCGYKDPTQAEDGIEETNNPKLRELCKRLADTFLAKDNLTEAQKIEFADGYLALSSHFRDDTGPTRGITIDMVYRALHQLEQRRGDKLKELPFIKFIVKTTDFSLAMSKQKDHFGKTVYVVITAHPTLRHGSNQEIIYVEE